MGRLGDLHQRGLNVVDGHVLVGEELVEEVADLVDVVAIGDLGLRANPVQGFIYADGDAKPDHRFGGGEPKWAANDWKPGNGLDLVVASLR